MLENINDYFSFITIFLGALMAFYTLFVVTDSHHDQLMKDRQENYYSYYENADDEFEEENRSDPYYE
ncbi:MAG: hypothetical protein E7194_12355 [Erysipelotrichaceae bacterium]|jgi:hypothetical protein|nr:hypothetical protein [Erysipelotrichaceae bacterium]